MKPLAWAVMCRHSKIHEHDWKLSVFAYEPRLADFKEFRDNSPCGPHTAVPLVEQRSATEPDPRAAVAGDHVETSLAEFRRRCEVLLVEEQEGASPNNALIAVLCDAVRLTREYSTLAASKVVAHLFGEEQAGT